MSSVKSEPRTRRAEKAERTAARIVEAARELFAANGYAVTTIEQVADRADVAVETVYSRFKNKPGLLSAVLGTTVTGSSDPQSLLETPDYRAVAATTDQREQIRMLAHLSRRTLERVATTSRILETAGSQDAQRALDQQLEYRMGVQRLCIDLLAANGPLRQGLSSEEAAATYSSLSSPTNYRMLTGKLGWSPERFEGWLADSLQRLLLDGED
ncbi:MAG: TetR/AcrR family transcriptional regulator [Marmoricola sp.]